MTFQLHNPATLPPDKAGWDLELVRMFRTGNLQPLRDSDQKIRFYRYLLNGLQGGNFNRRIAILVAMNFHFL